MAFCDPFDETLARHGPPSVFLFDPEGLLRFDPEWSRFAWSLCDAPPVHGESWLLLRDHDSGFVLLALVTSPTLLTTHPRADVRRFPDEASARAALAAFGRPPICREPW